VKGNKVHQSASTQEYYDDYMLHTISPITVTPPKLSHYLLTIIVKQISK
jgi:hypothetical protein